MECSAGADGCGDVNVVVPQVLDQDLQHPAVAVLGGHMERRETRRVPLGETGPVVDQHPGSLLVATLSLHNIIMVRSGQASLTNIIHFNICDLERSDIRSVRLTTNMSTRFYQHCVVRLSDNRNVSQ